MQSLNPMSTSLSSSNNKTNMRKHLLLGVSIFIFGVLYLKVLSPKLGIHIPCLFKEVTGHDCPGCGITRATLALLDGDIYQAFRYNMIIFILAPFFALYTILNHKGKRKTAEKLILAMVIVTILFGVLRNIPMFDFLAPTKIR